jgi:peroxygenase
MSASSIRTTNGRITLEETYSGLRRLGVGVLRSATFASVINGALGPATSRGFTLSIDTARIHLARHGSDTGVYDRRGRFSPARFRALYKRHDADGDGALGAHELARMFSRNRTDLLGHLGSRAEFSLLLELAGEGRRGRRVLTRERLEHFYNGSLFYTLAREAKARKAVAP